MCVCVRERERERETDRQTYRQIYLHTAPAYDGSTAVYANRVPIIWTLPGHLLYYFATKYKSSAIIAYIFHFLISSHRKTNNFNL